MAPRPGLAPPSLPSGNGLNLEVVGLRVELGGRAVLRDLNVTFHGGQVTALVGRNGVGKTTLLRALAGLQPFDGAVPRRTGAGRSA